MDRSSRLPALVKKLKQHGHRLTPQRMAILKIMSESKAHPSVEMVYEKVRADFPMTSLATVYKTVILLKEEGEILELNLGSGGNRYDAAMPFPHPHLICIRCQKIIDLEIQMFNELPLELKQKYGFEITNQRMDFYGVCPECQRLATDADNGR
jgi:Fur family peroxide stress response transcriptional regulator